MKTSILRKTVRTNDEIHANLSKVMVVSFTREYRLLETLAIVAILLARLFLTI